jgi:hypothetical protein
MLVKVNIPHIGYQLSAISYQPKQEKLRADG